MREPRCHGCVLTPERLSLPRRSRWIVGMMCPQVVQQTHETRNSAKKKEAAPSGRPPPRLRKCASRQRDAMTDLNRCQEALNDAMAYVLCSFDMDEDQSG